MKPPASHPYRHPDDLEAVMDLILTCRAEAPTDPWPPSTTSVRGSAHNPASRTMHGCGSMIVNVLSLSQ